MPLLVPQFKTLSSTVARNECHFIPAGRAFTHYVNNMTPYTVFLETPGFYVGFIHFIQVLQNRGVRSVILQKGR